MHGWQHDFSHMISRSFADGQNDHQQNSRSTVQRLAVLAGKSRAGRPILQGVGGAWVWFWEVGGHFEHQPQSSP